ncbi:S-adenosyl-L-methionine-dependent methyltransferase [Ascobolus immersus RN42]|uniref:S-adenosyl-L-methionine-dependent methyltransferase n=1 Tax=Ascobolus immersus RN42 TaxID=1160509 RepID=A0A3N4IN85_ASCIM|nr:S-adenosyl-L-methionine-dependent methyltransferase [Ascobolus immersus RN42]
MSAFSAPDFNANSYSASHPRVPTPLPPFLLSYLPEPNTTLLDIGCGPGLSTLPFVPYFTNIIGIDPSPPMIATANDLVASKPEKYKGKNIRFAVGTAEDFRAFGVEDASVDMVTCGEAAHYFDQAKFWPEAERVLRPGGIVGIWGYIDCAVTGAPAASEALMKWFYDDSKLGPYWEDGMRKVREWYKEIKAPDNGVWVGRKYWIHKAQAEGVGIEPEERVGEEKVKEGKLFVVKMKLGGLEEYFRTWSGVHRWKGEHPERKRRSEGGVGDVVDEMMEDIVKREKAWGFTEEDIKTGKWREKEVEVVWNHVVLIVQKRKD